MNDYSFGNFLYELRSEKGLSQSELGELMGVTGKAVSKWEMGVAKPRPAMLLALASFFGVTVEELLAGKRAEKQDEQDEKGNNEVKEAIAVQMHEYRKVRRRVYAAIILTVLSPLILITTLAVADAVNALDSGWTIGLGLGFLLLGILSFALIWVFLAGVRKQKWLIYACYPQRKEELNQLFLHSERRPSELAEETEISYGRYGQFFRYCRRRMICTFLAAPAYSVLIVLFNLHDWGKGVVLAGIICSVVLLVSSVTILGVIIRMRRVLGKTVQKELSVRLVPWRHMGRGKKAAVIVLLSVWGTLELAAITLAELKLILAAMLCMGFAVAVLFAFCVLMYIEWRRLGKIFIKKSEKTIDNK